MDIKSKNARLHSQRIHLPQLSDVHVWLLAPLSFFAEDIVELFIPEPLFLPSLQTDYVHRLSTRVNQLRNTKVGSAKYYYWFENKRLKCWQTKWVVAAEILGGCKWWRKTMGRMSG